MEQQKAMKYLKAASKGALVSVISGTVILLLLSWLIGKGNIPSTLMEEYVIVSVIISTFLGGVVSVRIQGKSAAVTALMSGAFILLGITIASMFANGIIFINGGYIKMLVSIFAGSMSGGILGTRRKTSKKRKKSVF